MSKLNPNDKSIWLHRTLSNKPVSHISITCPPDVCPYCQNTLKRVLKMGSGRSIIEINEPSPNDNVWRVSLVINGGMRWEQQLRDSVAHSCAIRFALKDFTDEFMSNDILV